MKVFHDPARAAEELPGPLVTIGNFDGLHLGHRAVIARARVEAKAIGAPCLALTFRPHPAAVLSDGGAPPRLASDAQQRDLFAHAGLDGVLWQPFDADFARLSPEQFVADYLRATLAVAGVVVGAGFRFGAHRSGDVQRLRALGTDGGQGPLRVTAVEPVRVGGVVVSSSGVRQLVSSGDVAAAARLLGRPVVLEGPVVQGDQRGRGLGFPTANIDTREMLLPCNGVYACVLRRDAELLPAVANVGRRPTFGGRGVGVEAHLLDFDGSLYGEVVRLAVLARLRAERRFSGAEELVAQVRTDVEQARRYLDDHPAAELSGVAGF